MIMGAALSKGPTRSSAAPAVTTKGVFAPSSPSNSRVVVPALTDEQLDLEEELQAKREEEAAEKQKTAVAHVVENLFPYAPVTVQTQKYPSSSPKAGQAYLWITVDEAEIKRRGGGASAVRYPVGVAVDSDGNVFVSEAGSTPKANANDSQIPYKISAENIMDFAANKKAPPIIKPPKLVETQQTELVVKWKKSMDSTVDRYEVQYRKADSVNNTWAGLAVVTACKHVSLSGIKCHTPFEFRVRARNPGGWNEYSDESIDDLHQMDSQYHKSLVWMLENDITDIIDETFSVEMEGAGKKLVVVDLKENGRDIPVTDVNKIEYVDLVVQWRTQFGAQVQMDALVQGFTTLIPLSAIKVFDMAELRMLVNGKPTIDVEELRSCTVFQGGYDEHAQVVLWLWQALREFTIELRGQFLKFMTGTNKIPLDGFEPPLNLTKSDLDPQALPRTHTCFNQLVLPEYTSYETLVEKVTFAITNAEGFELS
ncbi:hypothetical protein PF005_g6184 [Phytophthora fragariae]|uniref:HECT-type E3 ubiquitin transferase n=3 Tax=Phytophthora fragariae TaxID=53985 RepID=A0A6A3YRH6_9STRA|nr:hypothetical protein PF009_g3598 [Phytophthora fragariae]KAE9124818.1 hypothetical protein PF007_g6581 [Phytophthora fragariae]KAE9223770.1 hypothetical protein PF005_g6184 [Phytophthora fragariae]KAE9319839.1 hypothetical protein PF001_g5700 [Phytophthora fragariae]